MNDVVLTEVTELDKIAEFRRMHPDATTATGAELVRFAKGCGLIRGEWIAIDGTKFRAVASIGNTREQIALQRYLDDIEKAGQEQQVSIDPVAVQSALERLKNHPEPEASFMLVRQQALPAYNVQTAVDIRDSVLESDAHAAHCEAAGMMPYVPLMRTMNN